MTKHNELPANAFHDSTRLRQLGWDAHFDRQLEILNPQHGRIVRVASAHRGLFLVTDSQDDWLCSPAGKLLHSANHDYPVTGDWVLADDTVITTILPRRNLLSRGESGARSSEAGAAKREQAIAANLDTVFIISGLDRDFNIRRLERYVSLVYNCSLSPVIVLTKADLHDDPESCRLETEGIAYGVPVILSSAVDGRGKDVLESHLGTGRTGAMIGSSGAGKSTLANMLHGDDVQATGQVSDSVGKGCHTTTARELIRLPQGGMLIDNPGIREVAFHENGSGVESSFPDIQALAHQCRFADCSHRHEPNCAVLHAVTTGELPQSRLESYHKMKREMQYLAARSTKSADRIEKERWQDVSRLIKSINNKR